MVKVITYGTYDFLHYGHINLLKSAKKLGDYLIVGVTADDFDKNRGKINVQQSLMERVEAIRSTGIADEIIIEEYEGQKIDDINRYGVDIFTVGSDWEGKFDYLKEYCTVIYLPRTEGISSSGIRKNSHTIRLGLVGDSLFLNKVEQESRFVNGIRVSGICTESIEALNYTIKNLPFITVQYEDLLGKVDAIYLRSQPAEHYSEIKTALENGTHVLVESPVVLKQKEYEELMQIAESKGLILMEGIKTAYATAYARLMLLLKSGIIGKVVAVNATCTSIDTHNNNHPIDARYRWKGVFDWGPTALLPVFQILGPDYWDMRVVMKYRDNGRQDDSFAKMDFIYDDAVATIVVGNGVKSEGELVISGTNGYIYVPAPWWKTDYFEVRYEDQSKNKRYFYQLDGEGIRYELVAFLRAIEKKSNRVADISQSVTKAIVGVMERINNDDSIIEIR